MGGQMKGGLTKGSGFRHPGHEKKIVKNQKVTWVLLCNGAPAIGVGIAAAMAIVNSAFKNSDHLNYLLCHFHEIGDPNFVFVAPMSITKIIIQNT
jgi:hypothetical protein